MIPPSTACSPKAMRQTERLGTAQKLLGRNEGDSKPIRSATRGRKCQGELLRCLRAVTSTLRLAMAVAATQVSRATSNGEVEGPGTRGGQATRAL